MKEYYRVKANINLDAICKNMMETRKIIHENTKLMAIVKADAYGHGVIPVVRALDGIGIDAYGIAILEEGIEIREAGIKKPILILGYTPSPMYRDLVKYDITQAVFKYDMAKEISDAAVELGMEANIHIKLDTGMSRIGFSVSEESIETILDIAKLPNIKITGIFTHFACADEKDKASANRQLQRFNQFVKELEQKGLHIPMKHVSNSAGIIDMPEANLDMVRSGISTYGMYPSDEVDKSKLPLVPALELKSNIVFIKEVPEGVGVGYNSTYVTTKTTKIATIPVGYGDGYPRGLSSKGRVLIHGKSAPIIGRVCMDQFMVDITDIPEAKEGDEVTLVGRDQNEFISVEELAGLSYSFNYEFVCNIGKRIPRVYYKNGEVIDTRDYFERS
ncbi:alanine racemase [Anaeromicropila herbilytica]|uniref:Alanine racemase n=1 Tax=Anaeromicropila herbilytica TaxID=2785025 RepID=A0A7R7ENA3_9FIRM|nr:alanine racemase [Anaeromicropila herbilytica]BCN31933.1 alanine racemase 1 [Anaeromicropila herbilytica]